MDECPIQNVEQKEPDTKDYSQNSGYIYWEDIMTVRGYKGGFWGISNTLYLDLGVGSTSVFTL